MPADGVTGSAPRLVDASSPRRGDAGERAGRPSTTSSSAVSSPYRYSSGPFDHVDGEMAGAQPSAAISEAAVFGVGRPRGRSGALVATTTSSAPDGEGSDRWLPSMHPVGVGPDDGPVLERPGLTFGGVDHHGEWHIVGGTGIDHRLPLGGGGEPGSAAALAAPTPANTASTASVPPVADHPQGRAAALGLIRRQVRPRPRRPAPVRSAPWPPTLGAPGRPPHPQRDLRWMAADSVQGADLPTSKTTIRRPLGHRARPRRHLGGRRGFAGGRRCC